MPAPKAVRCGGGGGALPPKATPPTPTPQRVAGCEPSSDLSLGSRLALGGLSFFAKLTGVTYFGGLSISRTFAEGVGAIVTANYLYAADPQGGEAIIRSGGVQAAVGASAFGIGAVIGGATYQTVTGSRAPAPGLVRSTARASPLAATTLIILAASSPLPLLEQAWEGGLSVALPFRSELR